MMPVGSKWSHDTDESSWFQEQCVFILYFELLKYCTFTPVSGPPQAPVFSDVTEGDITGTGTTRNLTLTWTITDPFFPNFSQFILTQDWNITADLDIQLNVAGDLYSETVQGLMVGQSYIFTVRADTVCNQTGMESAPFPVNLLGAYGICNVHVCCNVCVPANHVKCTLLIRYFLHSLSMCPSVQPCNCVHV